MSDFVPRRTFWESQMPSSLQARSQLVRGSRAEGGEEFLARQVGEGGAIVAEDVEMPAVRRDARIAAKWTDAGDLLKALAQVGGTGFSASGMLGEAIELDE